MNESGNAFEIQLEPDLRIPAEAICADIGIDLAMAMRIFVKKLVNTRRIPFVLEAEPEFSSEEETGIMEAWEESFDPANLSGPFDSAREMIEHLHGCLENRELAGTR